MHCKRIETKYIYKGQYCSLCISGGKIKFYYLEDIKPDNIRKGMVLVSKITHGSSTRTFEAEIWTIDDSTKKVSLTYQPVLNINNIRQVAKFKSIEDVNSGEKNKKNEKDNFIIISSSEKTKVVFEFVFTPEYVFVDNHLLINDSLLKAYGIITKIF